MQKLMILLAQLQTFTWLFEVDSTAFSDKLASHSIGCTLSKLSQGNKIRSQVEHQLSFKKCTLIIKKTFFHKIRIWT